MPFGSIGDFLFGEEVDPTVEQRSTLTPEQGDLQRQLLAFLGQRLGSSGASPFPSLEHLSLAGLETLGASAQNPREQPEGLGDLFGGQGFEGFFDTTVQQPLLEQFQSEILPGISRQFGGNAFFDSDRGAADARAQDELLSTLTQERSRLGYQAAIDQNRAGLDAYTAGLQGDQTQAALISALLGGYGTLSNIQQTPRNNTISQILAAIGTPSVENIGFQGYERQGAIGDIAKIAGAFV